MDLADLKKDIINIIEKHEKTAGGKGLASDLALLTIIDTGTKKSKGDKTFFELSKKEQRKQVNSVGNVLGNAPKRSSAALKKASKKVFGKGIDDTEDKAPKRKARLVKGSKEAIEWGKKMKEARQAKSGD